MFKSKYIAANDHSPEADSKRFIAELKPYIFIIVIFGIIGAGSAAALILMALDVIWQLFFK
jgi:hypothetical protein